MAKNPLTRFIRVHRRAKNQQQRLVDAEQRCGKYLADANEAEESGDQKKADKLYAKSGFWRDRYNQLAGNS